MTSKSSERRNTGTRGDTTVASSSRTHPDPILSRVTMQTLPSEMVLSIMEHVVGTDGDAVLPLLATCRKWRHLALNASSLWANLELPGGNPASFVSHLKSQSIAEWNTNTKRAMEKRALDKAEYWKTRSRGKIRSLRVGNHWWVDVDTFPWEEVESVTVEDGSVHGLRSFLVSHSHSHSHSGSSSAGGANASASASGSTNSTTHTRIPNLRSLDIMLEDRRRVYTVTPSFWTPFLCPTLRSFTFVGSTITLQPLAMRLRCLESLDLRLDGFQPGEHTLLLDILRANEGTMRDVTVRSTIRIVSPQPSPGTTGSEDAENEDGDAVQPVINLANLRKFEFVTDRASTLLDTYSPIFSTLQLTSPYLRTLNLGWFCINYALIRIIEHCPLHNLTHLTLESVGVHTQALGRLLVGACNLERVTVLESRMAQEAIVLLLAEPGTVDVEREEIELLGFTVSPKIGLPPFPEEFVENVRGCSGESEQEQEQDERIGRGRDLLCPRLTHLEIIFTREGGNWAGTGVQIDSTRLQRMVLARLDDTGRRKIQQSLSAISRDPYFSSLLQQERERRSKQVVKPLQALTIRGCVFKDDSAEMWDFFSDNVPDFTFTS